MPRRNRPKDKKQTRSNPQDTAETNERIRRQQGLPAPTQVNGTKKNRKGSK